MEAQSAAERFPARFILGLGHSMVVHQKPVRWRLFGNACFSWKTKLTDGERTDTLRPKPISGLRFVAMAVSWLPLLARVCQQLNPIPFVRRLPPPQVSSLTVSPPPTHPSTPCHRPSPRKTHLRVRGYLSYRACWCRFSGRSGQDH